MSFIHHSKIDKFYHFLVLVIFLIGVGACNTTKYVPDDEYLLKKQRVIIQIPDSINGIAKKDLEPFLRQKPNKRILGFRFHLGVYNMSGKANNKRNTWLRNAGEAPVLFDPFGVEKNTAQLHLYLTSKGFRDAEIKDTVNYDNRVARVDYSIQLNQPYIIDTLILEVSDTALLQIILNDSANAVIKKGMYFDYSLLEKEMQRIETGFKREGYFYFVKDNIYFDVDTAFDNKKVKLYLNIQKRSVQETGKPIQYINHQKYYIDRINVFPDYKSFLTTEDNNLHISFLDSITRNGIRFYYNKQSSVRTKLIAQSITLTPNSLYNIDNVNNTYKNLASLNVFRLINFQFIDNDSLNQASGVNKLDCNIQLNTVTPQSYSVDIEGTNSSGDLGVAGNIKYQHRNIFRGAEVFEIRGRGAIEALRNRSNNYLENSLEIGADAKITIPQFLIPILNLSKFRQTYNPQTIIGVSYNSQQRPDFTRIFSTASYSYFWRGKHYFSHTLSPIEVDFVRLPYRTEQFDNEIKGTYLENSYKDHFISSTSYIVMYNNQVQNKNEKFFFVRYKVETSGNILNTYNNIFQTSQPATSRLIFGTPYSQYFMNDIDIRYYHPLNKTDKMAYRFFAGVAIPFGNASVIPFEKKYFSGGANGIRAWQVRRLGPGAFNGSAITSYPNSLGDMKLELNMEYQFHLISKLNGALFLDAGNIWELTPDETRPGSDFSLKTFPNQVAIGTGLGFRFDFSFVVLRLDAGIVIKDPSQPEGQRLIITTRPYRWSDVTPSISIGYPF